MPENNGEKNSTESRMQYFKTYKAYLHLRGNLPVIYYIGLLTLGQSWRVSRQEHIWLEAREGTPTYGLYRDMPPKKVSVVFHRTEFANIVRVFDLLLIYHRRGT